MSDSIVELVDNLPEDNITIKVLNALDFVVPGEWENVVGFDNAISAITGETDPDTIGQIRDRAIELYEDKENGYQTAIWLYQTLDNTDKAVAAMALADKIGDTFSFIPFLDRLTPKADSVQSIDLKLKVVAELIAYAKMNGLTINPIEFAKGLGENYNHESLMRMAALVCIDGILPLGADFISEEEEPDDAALVRNPVFGVISNLIPGDNKAGFIGESFSAVKGWMSDLIDNVGLSRSALTDRFGGFIDFADDKLDYLAAFLDSSTNYFEHTGIQTVARKVIERAYEDIQ